MQAEHVVAVPGDAGTVTEMHVTYSTFEAPPPSDPSVAGVDPGSLARLRERCKREGYAEGLEAARRDARAELDDELHAARAAVAGLATGLESAVVELSSRDAASSEALADAVVGIALGLVEVVIGDLMVEMPADVLRSRLVSSLELLASRSGVEVRHAPSDAAFLPADLPGVSFTADPSLRSGDLVVSGGDAVVDARFSSALERARESLTSP